MDFRLLGPLELVGDNGSIPLPGARQRALLSLLLLRANEIVGFERLIDQIWGARASSTAANTLQVHVVGLRKTLRGAGGVEIKTRPQGYQLEVEPDQVDIARFERLIRRGRQQLLARTPDDATSTLRDALELWRGEPFAEFADLPEPRAAAEDLTLKRAGAIESLFEAELMAGRHAEVVAEIQLEAHRNPLRERLWGQLMLAQYRSGRQGDALESYRRLRAQLIDELGVDPGQELAGLHRAILANDQTLAAPPARKARASGYRLPLPPNSLIGRAAVLAKLTAQLADPDRRLITLTGPGGIGKSRLALAAAEAAAGVQFPDGVFFAELASATTSEAMCNTIAGLVGARDHGANEAAAALAEHLAERRMLLVLDNFEQIVESAATTVAALLSASPGSKMLVTSRIRLRLAAEHEFAVPPLTLPERMPRPGEPANNDGLRLADNPAVRLFLDRAERFVETSGWRPDQLATVAAICLRLDGLPLAIELAASQIRLLSPAQLLDQLSQRLASLSNNDRDVPARHRTLLETIRWGYQLLDPAAQQLLAELSVFSGSFDLAAVVAVCRKSLADAVELLGTLVDYSTLRAEPGRNTTRYSLLATMRDYAAEQLAAAGAATKLARRHCLYYAQVLEPLAKVPTKSDVFTLQMLTPDADNYRDALRFAWVQGDIPSAALIGAGLETYWYNAGLAGEGQHWFDRLLSRRDELPTWLRSALLVRAANLADLTHDSSRSWISEALAGFGEIGAGHWVARCQWDLGWILMLAGEFDEADRVLQEATLGARAAGDDLLVARIIGGIAGVAEARGDYPRAVNAYLECIARHRERGELMDTAISLSNLSLVRLAQGDTTSALELADEAASLGRDLDSQPILVFALGCAAVTAVVQGDWPTATDRTSTAVQLAPLGNAATTVGEALTFKSLAALLIKAGDLESATIVLSIVATEMDQVGPFVSRILPTDPENVRHLLPAAEFEQAWKTGAAMTPERARAFARSMSGRLRAPDHPPREEAPR